MTAEDDRHEDSDGGSVARVHSPSWSPWIWILPAVAIFVAGFLVVRFGILGGKNITVRFSDARGLERYGAVRFRGAKVGTVKQITIDKDLGQVVVELTVDNSMKQALRKDTRFWIVAGGLEGGGGVAALLSGTYVSIAPGGGDQTREFVGQEYPPVLFPAESGRTFILETKGLGSLTVGSPVEFQGFHAGSILGAEYDDARGITLVHAFVVKRFQDQVRQGTRFWRAGGLNVSLAGGGLSVANAGLGSLLSAPVAFTTPRILAGAPAPAGMHFTLDESQTAAEAASDGAQVPYMTFFHGSVKGLSVGTPVQMNGLDVGRVRDVRLRYLPESATLVTPVTIEIDPDKLGMEINPSMTREELRARMNDAMQKLVQKGMRASLASSLVLPGVSALTLETTAAPGSGKLDLAHDPPIIPSAAAGSGIEGALSSISNVARTINDLPIAEIAEHIRNASAHVDAIASDPALHESLAHLNATLADAQTVVATARENIGPIATGARNAVTNAEHATKTIDQNVEPIARSLREAAASADAAAKRAEQLLGTAPRQSYDLGLLIKELTQTSQSVRALADYLTENPDSLLKGRKK